MSAAPTAAASATTPSRRHRRWYTTTTSAVNGTTMAPTWARDRASWRALSGIRAAARPRSLVTPSLLSVANQMKTARTIVAEPHSTSRTTSPGCR